MIMKQILVVCTANICRSPVVAGLLQQHLDGAGLDTTILVRSAGTYARPGKPVWEPICALMAERRIDLQRHRSQPISSEMVQAADLIVVMEESHRQSVFYLDPRALRKAFLLSELAGESDPLPDVMGHPLPEVRQVCDIAAQWVEQGWGQILTRLALSDFVANGTGRG